MIDMETRVKVAKIKLVIIAVITIVVWLMGGLK